MPHIPSSEDLGLTVLPKLLYRFNTTPIKILIAFFAEIEKLILKSVWKLKGPRIAKTILKKDKIGGFTLSNFKTYYIATVFKTGIKW